MKRLAAMGAYRISLYLKEEGTIEYWTRFPRLLASDVTREALLEMEDYYFSAFEEEDSSLERLYDMLRPNTDAGRLAWCCLELALLYHMNSQIGEVFSYIYPRAQKGPTIYLAAKLLFGEDAVLEKQGIIQTAFSKIELLLLADYPVQEMGNALLLADDRLIAWMDDRRSVLTHPLIENSFFMSEQSSPVWESKRQSMLKALSHTGSDDIYAAKVVAVSGEKGNGRRFLMRQIAFDLDRPLVIVETSFLGSQETWMSQWRKILRECLLTPTLVCIAGIEKTSSWETMLSILVEEYEKVIKNAYLSNMQELPSDRPLFLTTAPEVKLVYLLKQVVLQETLPMPNLLQRAELWEFFAEKYLEGRTLPAQELAVKMKLPVGSVEKAVKRLAALPKDEAFDHRQIFKYCYEILDDGRYDNVKRVETSYTYDDLKLEPQQKQIIRDICAQVEYRKKVLSDWNLQTRYAYGTSVSALFSGPPGTGKTMAAHVMAGILGLELYKVDISQIVDKYIGETEKRLEEVFRRAECSNMILFFDEADAIIGKRSETKEAKDKYANTEVAYLLQRMEEYDGIVILSTNYSQNIDAAFMRRIRFTVHFPLPDEQTRKEIWMSAFAKDTPLGFIDYEYLARQFEFSGAQIKNVVWNACFFAAEDGSMVEMQHMVRAIQMELTKEKKVSFTVALGEYAHLLYS